MLIISGHDTSISLQELFLIFALNLNISFFRYPSFASQIALEITKNDEKNNKNYSDYFVNYYFNDEHLFNISADIFFKKIEPNIWSDEKINLFCDSNYSNNSYDNNTTNNNTNNNNSRDDIEEEKNIHKLIFSKKDNDRHMAILIVFISLFGVSFAINLILAFFLLKKNIVIPPPKRHIPVTESTTKL